MAQSHRLNPAGRCDTFDLIPNSRPRRPASAFTLVELLVSIAIIGILVALLLPAIQQAREAARKMQCASHIKQLTLAAHGYVSDHGKLPPSGVVEPKTLTDPATGYTYPVFDQQSGKMFSWAVLLLPYVEETTLYNQFDQSKNIVKQITDPQRQTVPVYLCPSDAARGRYFSHATNTANKRFAKSNYAAYVSPMHTDMQLVYPGALISTGQKTSRITDGLSKTVVFSEVRTLDDTRDERGVWALPWNASSLLALDMHHDTATAGGNLKEYVPLKAYAYQSQVPNTIGPNADVLLDCPNDMLVTAQLERMPCITWGWNLGLYGYISAAPRSSHIGGVNVSYLDGHVDFIRDEIDPFVFAYLVDIRDAKALSNDGQ